MRPSFALRMFRQTPRMLRPIPVSLAMDGRFFGPRYDINWLTEVIATEGRPGWYVEPGVPVEAPRTTRELEYRLGITSMGWILTESKATPSLSDSESSSRSRLSCTLSVNPRPVPN
ncbi:hypothetical protein FALBO_1636 [Fusarium albosuccineum]|uniref:Uncharacterized protein n=1 Tax=Fusarium albosuccineum TaxID=1237068 RepID=A0A8H4PID0_9HYPO|nr:hypothetical protein FALBO_1636 [Fusarium albosuccineum]